MTEDIYGWIEEVAEACLPALRDRFALAVLPRFAPHTDPEEAAKLAYEYADAALKARG